MFDYKNLSVDQIADRICEYANDIRRNLDNPYMAHDYMNSLSPLVDELREILSNVNCDE